MFALQGGDVSSGADFARAKRYKKLTARLNSATARSKMTWLRRHSLYVLLFLIAAHTGGFIATRLLLASQKSHVASVCTLLHYIYVELQSSVSMHTQQMQLWISLLSSAFVLL